MTALAGARPVRTLLLWLALMLAPWLAWGQDVLPVPELRARVMDQTGPWTRRRWPPSKSAWPASNRNAVRRWWC